MTNITKIALGFGVTGITGLSIYEIMKRRKLAQKAFDAEISEDKANETAVENNEESSTEDELPEFTKYTGIPVDTVTKMLNAVTHKHYCHGSDDFYYITSKDFESIRESLGVSRIYIRDNYLDSLFNNVGEMVTFRIREDYCVSNDGWFFISGTWKYLFKDEVQDDFIRCAKCKERRFEIDKCLIL